MPSLTKRFVDTATPPEGSSDITYWDDKLTGFGLRIQRGTSKSWVIMYRNKEGRLRKHTIGKADKLAPEEARKLAKKKLADVTHGLDPAGEKTAARRAMTVTELCDLYLKEAAEHIKASTLAMDKSRIERHVKPLLGNRTAAGLTLNDIERFQSDVAAGKTAKTRQENGRSGLTTGGKGVASRTVGMLGTVFEFAKRKGIIQGNPARGVKRYEDKKNKRYLTLEEISKLGKAMQEAETENRTGIAAIRALLLTGCRKNEILSLPWAWLDAKAYCIRFGDTKSGAQLRPIGAEAAKHLAAQPKRTIAGKKGREENPWVFPADRGEGHFIGLPKVLERLCARAGLEGVTVHVLRHSFAAAAAELGFSELTIAGLLGHTVPGITARYAHVPDSALVSAADRVSARIASALDGTTGAVVKLERKRIK